MKIITVVACVIIGNLYRIAIDVMISGCILIGLVMAVVITIPLYFIIKIN